MRSSLNVKSVRITVKPKLIEVGMNTMEIANGETLIGLQNCGMIGSVTPVPDGHWVTVGYPNQPGLLIDGEDWKSFVDLINQIDTHLKRHYG